MTCGFAHDDASYVLGALSPAERQRFEQHLDTCDECRHAVQEMAGLPGLLARVDPAVLEHAVDERVPDTLLPALVAEVGRRHRRRRLVVAGSAVAALVCVAAGSFAVTRALDGNEPTPPGTAAPVLGAQPGQSMVPVGHGSVRARLLLEQVAWGTRLDLVCRYAHEGAYRPTVEPSPPVQGPAYSMVVRTRDGRTERVATWRALPGKTMRLSAATASARASISSVEVRTANGRTVLRLAG